MMGILGSGCIPRKNPVRIAFQNNKPIGRSVPWEE